MLFRSHSGYIYFRWRIDRTDSRRSKRSALGTWTGECQGNTQKTSPVGYWDLETRKEVSRLEEKIWELSLHSLKLKMRFPRKKYVRCEEKRAEAGPQGSIR